MRHRCDSRIINYLTLMTLKTPEMTGTKSKFRSKFRFRLDSVPVTGRNFAGILNLVYLIQDLITTAEMTNHAPTTNLVLLFLPCPPISLNFIMLATSCDSLRHAQVICVFCDTSENIATCHMSLATCHKSLATCHSSHATCLENLRFFATCPLKMA